MRRVIIDADVLSVQAAVVNQKAIRWGGDEEGERALWTLHAFEEDGEATFTGMVQNLIDKTGADEALLVFSDKVNWRKTVLPTYKHNRSKTVQPLLRSHLTTWAQETFPSISKPTLEGDDVCGILLTRARKFGEEIVVASIDKDFKTVPGHHYNFNTDTFFEVTEEEADYWHLYQTLMGDTTDGYSGCPGIGPVAAKRLLDKSPTWDTVVAAFDKAGLCEEEALVQARVARILRASDYDFKNQKVKLWTP